MKKLIYTLVAIMCGVYAGEAQEDWCGDKSLSYCINHFDKQCSAKNYDACSVVGDLHYEQKQYSKSKKYYEMVCDKANSKDSFQLKLIDGSLRNEIPIFIIMQLACKNLAEYYNDGLGVRQDFAKSLQYDKKACNLGYALSCTLAGRAYFLGKGAKQDYKLAKSHFEKACEMQSGFGCGMLGAMYHNGAGVPKNLSKAKELFGKACDLGLQQGCDDYKMLNMWK